MIERTIRADFCESGETLSRDESSHLAQTESNRLRQQYFDSGISFSFETVLSDPVGNKVAFMKKSVENGYLVALLAVGLDSPAKSRKRVDLRVQRGGHDVPTKRIFDRYPRVIDNIKKATNVVSLALVVDNSTENLDTNYGAYKAFALYLNGRIAKMDDDIPRWW